jgi:response regulator RpfG family c-di-GMP phosphodiesterase
MQPLTEHAKRHAPARVDENRHIVLVVENEPDIMEFVRTVLVDHDLNVVSASDGEEALSYLMANAPPSLVLLDFSMPNMDGFDLGADADEAVALRLSCRIAAQREKQNWFI